MATIVADLVDGAHSLGELDFAALCRRRRLPEPERQVVATGSGGRCYLDVRWREGLVVEVDGRQHLEGLAPVQDMLRQNSVSMSGDVVLRIPLLGMRLEPDAFERAKGEKAEGASAGEGRGAPAAGAGVDVAAHEALAARPARGARRGGLLLAATEAREDGDERGDLLGRRVADDLDGLRRRLLRRGVVGRHSGMFPCFFAGRVSRLVRRARRARLTFSRVLLGVMTVSTYPRSAAT